MKKLLLRLALTAAAIPAVLLLLAFAAWRIANHTNGTIVSSGVERSYLLYVPDSYNPDVPTPLVITIHGFAQWPDNQRRVSRWDEIADEHGFIVVYPMGTRFPLRWQGGEEDVTFISDLIDKLAGEYNIDPERIYANGLSNGGGMSFALACNLSDRIAAVGMVAGAYMVPWEQCKPERQVPAIVFHGTEDRIVPYSGWEGNSTVSRLPDITEWVAAFARYNGCSPTPAELPANGDVRGVEYEGCAADVVFYTIEGGGHTWPGGGYLPAFITGATTEDISASEVMWVFFQEHPLN